MTAAETASREWAAGGACAVRLLRRAEIWQVASLLDLSFAANQAARSPITAALTRLRLALDVERRTTPWDWCRHQQFVVEDTSTGRLLGFAELWAENAAACGAAEAATPQPVVFNLCVAPAARRRGIARRLLSQCESAAQRWGEGGLFLKVEHDNAAALSLYRRLGYVTLDEREPAELEATAHAEEAHAAEAAILCRSTTRPCNQHSDRESLLGTNHPGQNILRPDRGWRHCHSSHFHSGVYSDLWTDSCL